MICATALVITKITCWNTSTILADIGGILVGMVVNNQNILEFFFMMQPKRMWKRQNIFLKENTFVRTGYDLAVYADVYIAYWMGVVLSYECGVMTTPVT